MSGSLKPIILEEAVRIWSDPDRRWKGLLQWHDRYCAKGVINHALEKTINLSQMGFVESHRLRCSLGFNTRFTTFVNDMIPGGQRYLFWRMQRALKKAKQEK